MGYIPCALCCSHDRRPLLWATLTCKIWPDLRSMVFLCFGWPLKGQTTCTRKQGLDSFHGETLLEASQPEIYSFIYARAFDKLQIWITLHENSAILTCYRASVPLNIKCMKKPKSKSSRLNFWAQKILKFFFNMWDPNGQLFL